MAAAVRASTKLSWTQAELEAWKLPEQITPSEWADKFRLLSGQSAEPGRWRTARTPYLREIMDSLVDPDVEQITLIKCTQVGGTELTFNLVGYIIDQDPGPLLFVMPTESDARGLAGTRLRRMIEDSPKVAAHLTGNANDTKGILWELDRMNLKLGWAESDSSLASMPCRYVVLDELGKYRVRKGEVGSDRVKLAFERTRTFRHSRKIIKTSTPENASDLITREFEQSDKRRYWVPCPECGHHAPLVFPKDGDGHRFRFHESERDPERIKRERLAWFECRECSARIDGRSKMWMLQRGIWCPEGCTITAGKLRGQTRPTSHRGYHIWAAYSPWVDWSEIAAEWLEAQGSIELLKAFINNVLGEPWEDKAQDTQAAHIRARSLGYEAGTVPGGTLLLTTGVDVQADHLWFATRAWMAGERSYLVRAGRVETFEQLEAEVVRTAYPVVDQAGNDTAECMANRLVLIDSGYRQDEVYAFCRGFAEICRPTKGAQRLRGAAPFVTSAADKDMRGRNIIGGMHLWTINTTYFKDKLTRLMHAETDQPGAWFVHRGVSDQYLLQMTAEHKVREYRGGRPTENWKIKKNRGANHLWDCEVLNVAAEDMLGLPYRQYHGGDSGAARPWQSADAQLARRAGRWIEGGRSGLRRGGWVRR